jgi:soluble lytic murein transglycosylase-like protein
MNLRWWHYAAGVVGVGLLFILGKSARPPASEVQSLIAAEADRQGVSRAWALAWAEQESTFDPTIVGDPNLARRWQHQAAADQAYFGNAALEDQSLWVSYGLYQLPAVFWLKKVDPSADPRVLLDPALNARLGVGMLKTLIARTGGDYAQARFIAAGCADRNCDRADTIASRAAAAAQEWGLA